MVYDDMIKTVGEVLGAELPPDEQLLNFAAWYSCTFAAASLPTLLEVIRDGWIGFSEDIEHFQAWISGYWEDHDEREFIEDLKEYAAQL